MFGSKTPEQQIQELKAQVDELRGALYGTMAYVAHLRRPETAHISPIISLARELTQKHTFDIPGRKVDIGAEAKAVASRLFDIAKSD